ncbi:GGDEF domain-containing protein [Blastococcus sp. SYSU D01042]
MDGLRRAPAATLLAALYLVGGALCFIGAAWPMSPGAPVDLLWVMGVVGVLVGGTMAVLGRALPAPALHAALAVVSLLIAVLAWRSATAVGIVGLGPALTGVALYSAHVLSLPAARAHTWLAVAGASAGAAAAEPSDFLQAWLALCVTVLALVEAQGRLARRLRDAADTDALTGVANRRAWEEQASRHLARALRSGEPLSIAILDLDDFKLVNDQQGHGAGDTLLQELAAGWTSRLRHADLLGRYGGDEFVLCLPATDRAGAEELMGRLQATHRFRWSVGLATVQPGDTLSGMLARADQDLYVAKRAGRCPS